MMYLKTTKTLTKEDVKSKIKEYEGKYKMSLSEFEENVVKGNESELDEKGIYSEYEEWKYYSDSLKEEKMPLIEDIKIRPLKPLKSVLEVFTEKRLSLLEVLNENKVNSISQLSDLVERDRGSVYTDLKILARADLVFLKKEGRKVTPVANANKIEIEL